MDDFNRTTTVYRVPSRDLSWDGRGTGEVCPVLEWTGEISRQTFFVAAVESSCYTKEVRENPVGSFGESTRSLGTPGQDPRYDPRNRTFPVRTRIRPCTSSSCTSEERRKGSGRHSTRLTTATSEIKRPSPYATLVLPSPKPRYTLPRNRDPGTVPVPTHCEHDPTILTENRLVVGRSTDKNGCKLKVSTRTVDLHQVSPYQRSSPCPWGCQG